MRLGTRSARLLATISPLALSLALASTVSARTLVETEIDVAQIISAINTQTVGNSANIINSALAAVSSSVAAEVDSGTGSLDSINNVADSNTSIGFEANTIFAIARGTDALNQIGTLDTGAVVGEIDGAAIHNGGFTDAVDLHAFVVDSTLVTSITGSGAANLDTTFDSNVILAEGTFNRGTSTIEVTIPGSGLADPVFGAGYIEPGANLGGSFASRLLVTAATLNVVNVQTNFDFESTDGNTAFVDNNTILLDRNANAADPLGGTYAATNNAISARANGNVSDNSIFIREEIETGSGTEVGSLLFEGNGAIANYQLSDNDIPGALLSAENVGSTIHARFRRGALGGVLIAHGESLSLELSDNTVESSARLNASRNEITIDGAMQLDGQFDWDSLGVAGHDQIVDLDESTGFGTGSELFAAGDFYIVNRQFVESGSEVQAAYAETRGADVALSLEDMDSDGSVVVDSNAITAGATANSSQNIIGNTTPDAAEGTSPSIDTVLASVNSQFAGNFEVEGVVLNNVIRTDIGYRDSNLGIEGFGGFEGSSLTMNGNSIAAGATANAGTSSVGLAANTIDNSYDSDDGAASSVENSGAFLNSDPSNDTYQASAGTVVLNSQRTLNGDESSLVGAFLGEPGSGNTIQLFVNAHALDDTNPESVADALTTDSIDGSSFEVSGNSMEAAATGNSFNSLVNHDAGTTYTGSVGTLSQQALEGTEVTGEAYSNTIDVDLAVDDDLTGPIADVSLAVDGNQIVARGTGNQVTTTTLVAANTFNGGAWTGFNDGTGLEDTTAGAIQSPLANDSLDATSTLNASLGALTDQVFVASTAFSESDDNDILVDLVNEPNGGSVLDIAGSASVANNTLGAQSRGNEADNLVMLDVATTASSALGANTNPDVSEYGPLAGIVARQAITGDDGSEVEAVTGANNIVVRTGGLLTGSLDVSGNRVIANAIGNLISNEVSVSALSLDVGPIAGIASSYVDDTSGGDDLYTESSVFILNSQRNEGQDPEDELVRGAPVTALLDNGNSVSVTPDNLTSSTVSVDGNLLQATAAGNSASNGLSIDIGSGPIFADILNRQGNSGDISATNDGSSVTLDIEDANGEGSDTTSANTNMTASLDNNSIGSAAFGSSVFNGLSATAGSNFTPTNAISSASTSPSASNDSNGAMEAHGNMVVLNNQRTYGFEGDEVQISASTTNATIALNATGGMNQGSTSADGNRISAAATANDAVNVISAASGSGSGLPSATINNVQHTSFANVTATVTSASISTTIGGAGVGANLGGSTSVVGGTISASATGNSAVNRISSQGQSFTRSGSF